MAQSPAHKFGQIVGEVLEMAIEPVLRQFADDHNLYLDKKGRRPARRGRKVSWVDLYGNAHDLDFVLERDGGERQIGTPVAFIETAWRRYTKHSRNKAQEIQGAIVPLVATHRNAAPFIGVILAGVFTDGALTQLSSLGFSVLHFSYDTVMSAFSRAGVDATFDEATPDVELAAKVAVWEALPEEQRIIVSEGLIQLNPEGTSRFMAALRRAVMRQVELVRVVPLHGVAFQCGSVDQAIAFIENYSEDDGPKPVAKYEVAVRYSNGDRIEGQFADKESAVQFLLTYRPPPLRAA